MNAYEAIPGLTLDEGEPVFSEPWEAQAFALVVALHGQGHFTWPEWAEVLSETIHQGDPDQAYYVSWLEALDTIAARKSLITGAEFGDRAAQWKRALEATPHGEPILLENGAQI